MNTNLIALLKTSAQLLNAQGMSLYAIVEDLEMTYDAMGGEPMGKKLLTACAVQWIKEGVDVKCVEVSGYATV